MLESVARADLRHDSLARVDWQSECEAAVNEQVKCVRPSVHLLKKHTHTQLGVTSP